MGNTQSRQYFSQIADKTFERADARWQRERVGRRPFNVFKRYLTGDTDAAYFVYNITTYEAQDIKRCTLDWYLGWIADHRHLFRCLETNFQQTDRCHYPEDQARHPECKHKRLGGMVWNQHHGQMVGFITQPYTSRYRPNQEYHGPNDGVNGYAYDSRSNDRYYRGNRRRSRHTGAGGREPD